MPFIKIFITLSQVLRELVGSNISFSYGWDLETCLHACSLCHAWKNVECVIFQKFKALEIMLWLAINFVRVHRKIWRPIIWVYLVVVGCRKIILIAEQTWNKLTNHQEMKCAHKICLNKIGDDGGKCVFSSRSGRRSDIYTENQSSESRKKCYKRENERSSDVDCYDCSILPYDVCNCFSFFHSIRHDVVVVGIDRNISIYYYQWWTRRFSNVVNTFSKHCWHTQFHIQFQYNKWKRFCDKCEFCVDSYEIMIT